VTSTREVLSALFDAENRRDWDRYVEFLHADVEWTVGGRVLRGREDYVRAIQLAYAGSGVQFWLNLQTRYDLEVAQERVADEVASIAPLQVA